MAAAYFQELFQSSSPSDAAPILEKVQPKQIGSGRRVNIWNDPWLLGHGDGRIRSQNINIHFTLVFDLIDADSCTWKYDSLCNLFDTEVVDRIYYIPLPHSDLQDDVIWTYGDTSDYTVKSGYRLLRTDGPDDQTNLAG
ncbi:hypothetical protein V6N13_126534 [Hibiscus sabdariffa]